MKVFLLHITILGILTISSGSVSEIDEPPAGRKVVAISVDGSINPSSSEYIHEGIRRASEEKAECIIIKLNTPGGLLKSKG